MSHAGFPSPGLFLLLYFREGLPATLSNHSTIVSCVSRAAAHQPLQANTLPVNREPRRGVPRVSPAFLYETFVMEAFQTWRRCLTGEQGHVGVFGVIRAACHSADFIARGVQTVHLQEWRERSEVRGQTHPNLQRLRRCYFESSSSLRPLVSLAISILAILKKVNQESSAHVGRIRNPINIPPKIHWNKQGSGMSRYSRSAAWQRGRANQESQRLITWDRINISDYTALFTGSDTAFTSISKLRSSFFEQNQCLKLLDSLLFL